MIFWSGNEFQKNLLNEPSLGVSKPFPKGVQKVPWRLQKVPKGYNKNPQKVTKSVPKSSKSFPKDFQKLSKKLPKVSKHFKKLQKVSKSSKMFYWAYASQKTKKTSQSFLKLFEAF